MDTAQRRVHLERTAATLFVGATIAMTIVCGAVIVSGWFAGVIEDRFERLFWAGAILAGVAIAVLAAAAVPGGVDDRRTIRRVRVLLTVGLLLFVLAPTLCIVALILDFFL